MKEPFAYVLYIHSRTREFVSLHQSLDEAEDALRAYAGDDLYRPQRRQHRRDAHRGWHSRAHLCLHDGTQQADQH
jgi:hypothetical protein